MLFFSLFLAFVFGAVFINGGLEHQAQYVLTQRYGDGIRLYTRTLTVVLPVYRGPLSSNFTWPHTSDPNLPPWELLSLFKLYSATDGQNWNWRAPRFGAVWNFTVRPNPCAQQWQGINCTYNATAEVYHVVALELPSYNLKGFLPVAISDLSELTQLTLSANSIYGYLPQEMNNLTHLVGLSLNNNDFSGTLPATVGELRNLQQLQLYNNRFSGPIPESIGNLTQLQTFTGYYNHFSGTLPESIGQLASLQTLNLNTNKIHGSLPASVGELKVLTTLDLDHCALTGSIPESIGNLSSLRTLYLYNNYLTGPIPDTVGGLTHLVEIQVQYNLIDGEIPLEIFTLPRLQSLDVYSNLLRGSIPAQIGNLTSMKYLGLDENRLTGTIPAGLGDCTGLLRLYLNENELTGPIPQSFSQLRQLQYLNVYGNSITGTVPSFLGDLNLLSNLGLDLNLMHGTIPSSLGNLTLMRSFYVNGNQLQGIVPASLADMNLLQGLFLDDNQLTGTLPEFLTTLSRLRNIEIGNNRFTGTIPAGLGNLTDVQYMYMNNLLLSGSIPASLGNLQELQFFSLSANMLTGSIPRDIARLSQLRELLLDQNQLTGTIESLFSPSQGALETVLLARNSLTGTLPATLFALRSLNTVVFISNCFHGRLPESICNATSMRSLVMDGLSSAHTCRNPVLPRSSAYTIERSVHGTVPACLFTLPKLNTLHMSGNGFTGALPELSEISTELIDVSLSHNILTGTIPSVIQRRQWYNLDLSFNRLTGLLVEDFATVPVYASSDDDILSHHAAGHNITLEYSLSLENNCLSGRVPGTVHGLGQISVLGSNIFSCEIDHSDLPVHDHSKRSYECGSTAFDVPYFLWLGITGMCALSLLAVWLAHRYLKHRGFSRVEEWVNTARKYMDYSYSRRERKSQLNVFNNVIEVICKITVFCAAFILVVLLPVYSFLSPRYGGMTHQYAYAVSGAFLSGVVPMATEMPLLVVLLILTMAIFARLIAPRLRHEAKRRRRGSYVAPHVDSSVFLTKALIFVLFLVFDLIIVVGFNVAYVYIAIYESSVYHVLAQIGLSLFKVVWNNVFTSIVLRFIVRSVTTTSFTARDSKYSENEFVSLQVFAALLNNIAVPCLVVAVISPSCFYNVFVPAPKVESVYTYTYCSVFNADTGDCTTYLPDHDSAEYNPPFTYNFNCSFSLITYYSPAFVSLCIVSAFVAPAAQLLLQYLHGRADKRTLWFLFLDTLCPRILKPLDETLPWTPAPEVLSAPAVPGLDLSALKVTVAASARKPSRAATVNSESGQSTPRSGNNDGTNSARSDSTVVSATVPTIASYEELTYFKANQVLISLLTYLGLLLTFGTMFPPLAVAMALTVLLWALFAKYKVGRFLTKAIEGKLLQYVDLVDVECQGVGSVSVLQKAMWMLITVSCWFYTIFLFDTLGHAVGLERAYWVLIVMPLMPLVLYAGFKCYKWRILRVRTAKGGAEGGMELQTGVNILIAEAARENDGQVQGPQEDQQNGTDAENPGAAQAAQREGSFRGSSYHYGHEVRTSKTDQDDVMRGENSTGCLGNATDKRASPAADNSVEEDGTEEAGDVVYNALQAGGERGAAGERGQGGDEGVSHMV
jgi:Leucine-rich repeat (LRR) protein